MLGIPDSKLQISDRLAPAFWSGFIIGIVVVAAVFMGALASAQSKAARRPVVAVTSIASFPGEMPQVRGLLDGLAEAGYVDGDKISLQRIAAGNPAQLRSALAERMKSPLDLIVATSAIDAAVVKSATSQTPIVFAPARDPVESGLIRSLAQPATNLTGLSYSRGVEDTAKQLAVFKQMWPTLKRVALFYSATGVSGATLQAVRRAGELTNTSVAEHPVEVVSDAERIVPRTAHLAGDGILSVCSALFRGIGRLTASAERVGVPVFGCTSSQVADEGALLTYAPDIYYLGYRGAWYVDRILKGAKPQHLAVEVPSRFELVINLKVAERLRIKIPPHRLILADKVFS